VKKTLWTIATVVIGAALIAVVGLGFHSQFYKAKVGWTKAQAAGTVTLANGQVVPHVILRLDSFPDSSGMFNGVPIHKGGNPGWPAYGPSNEYSIPAHALVTVVWDQRDSGGQINNPYFAIPHGTVGPITLNGKAINPSVGIDPSNVGHTFTVRAVPGYDPNFFLNVAAPANGDSPDDASSPQVMKFSFVSPSKGLYAWNCEFPCGTGIGGFGAVMGAYGYMSGYLHVV